MIFAVGEMVRFEWTDICFSLGTGETAELLVCCRDGLHTVNSLSSRHNGTADLHYHQFIRQLLCYRKHVTDRCLYAV